MIIKLSQDIAFYFVKHGIIEESDMDLYRYGMETVFCNIFDIGIVLISGLVYGKLLEAIWYYVIFCSLRKLSEGYHAKTFEGCKLLMLIMMCSVMMISNVGINISMWHIFVSAVVLAIIVHNVTFRCRKWKYLSAYIESQKEDTCVKR